MQFRLDEGYNRVFVYAHILRFRLAQARRKKTTINSEQSPVIPSQLQRGLREGAMIVLMALALFLFTALVTYHASDPGWSYTGTRDAVHNAAGAVGAWFADVLFNLFGYLSYLFPVIIAYSGWLVLRSNHIEVDKDIDYHELGIRWAGFFVTVAMGCALTSMHFSLPMGELPLDGGGILGRMLSDSMAGSMGLLGSTLILLALFLAGITLFSGVSWFRVIDGIGSAAHGEAASDRTSATEQSSLHPREERDRPRCEVIGLAHPCRGTVESFLQWIVSSSDPVGKRSSVG